MAKSKSNERTLAPRVVLPLAEYRQVKAALAWEGISYSELVLTLTRRWLAARTQQETPSDGEGVS